MSRFTYDQCQFESESQIRLLELKYSASGVPQWSFTRPLNIGANGEIDAKLQFVALSYEWGSSEIKIPFTINGQEMALRCNLVELLNELPALREKCDLPCLFWIDSICINQDDVEEKNDQIRLLRCVYSSAECVLSWLGPMREGSNLAMKYLCGVGVEAGSAVDSLLNRRYWTRLWMVQEVILGRAWYVACGSDIIDGNYLTRLFDSTTRHSTRRSSQWRHSRAYNLISERLRFESSQPLALVDLMLRFYELDAEFRVDKIRALLAVSRPDTVGNIHELLIAFVESAGVHDRLQTVVSKICKGMCRLAQLDVTWKEARLGDIESFVEGILIGSVQTKSLDFIADRLRCSRMSVGIVPPLIVQHPILMQLTSIEERWDYENNMSSLRGHLHALQMHQQEAGGRTTKRTPRHQEDVEVPQNETSEKTRRSSSSRKSHRLRKSSDPPNNQRTSTLPDYTRSYLAQSGIMMTQDFPMRYNASENIGKHSRPALMPDDILIAINYRHQPAMPHRHQPATSSLFTSRVLSFHHQKAKEIRFQSGGEKEA